MASILLASTPTRHVAMDLAKVVIVQEAETNDSDAEVVGSGEPLPDQRQAAAAAQAAQAAPGAATRRGPGGGPLLPPQVKRPGCGSRSQGNATTAASSRSGSRTGSKQRCDSRKGSKGTSSSTSPPPMMGRQHSYMADVRKAIDDAKTFSRKQTPCIGYLPNEALGPVWPSAAEMAVTYDAPERPTALRRPCGDDGGKTDPRCLISFRCTVVSAITFVVCLCCAAMLAPIEIFTRRVREETIHGCSSAIASQRELIDGLIFTGIAGASYTGSLDYIALMVERYVKEPPNKALSTLLDMMKIQWHLNSSWRGDHEAHRGVVEYTSWMALAAQWMPKEGAVEHDKHVGDLELRADLDNFGEFFRQWHVENLHRPRADWLYAAWESDVVVGCKFNCSHTPMVNGGECDGTAAYSMEGDGGSSLLTWWQLDLATSHRLSATASQLAPGFAPRTRPWYELQAAVARADPAAPLQSMWSGIYEFMNGAFGLTLTAPLAPCGRYSCFEGVAGADITLGHFSHACREFWLSLKRGLAAEHGYRIGRANSSIFMVNHVSWNEPEQEGLLLGTSEENAYIGLIQASASLQPVLRLTARALLAHFGSWRAEELRNTSHILSFRPSAAAREPAEFEPCALQSAAISMTADAGDCLRLGTQSIELDAQTRWLAVVVLPAGAFGARAAKTARAAQAEADKMGTISEERVQEARKLWFFIFLAAASVSILIGLCIGVLVSQPVQQLSGLMTKLADMNFAFESEEFAQLCAGKRSNIRDVNSLQCALFRLACGVETFARFLPETVVQSIVRGDDRAARLHVEQREVTIMFSDIRGFTGISESLDQADLLFILTRYLSVMTRVVEHFSGVVAEILGDGLLVFWNTPNDVKDHAAKACAAALAQQEALQLLNNELSNLGLPELAIRIGLHTGTVLSGNIGSETKMKFGCMGDPINLASRLEGLCKHYGVGIICSEATHEQLPRAAGFFSRRLDLVRVMGRAQAVNIYELIGRDGELSSPGTPTSGAITMAAVISYKTSQTGRATATTTTTTTPTTTLGRVGGDCSDEEAPFGAPLPSSVAARYAFLTSTTKASAMLREKMQNNVRRVMARPIERRSGGDALSSPRTPALSDGRAQSKATNRSRSGAPTPRSFSQEHVSAARRALAELYEQALDAYQEARFVEALRLAEAVLQIQPEDMAAQSLVKRAAQYVDVEIGCVVGFSIEDRTTWTGEVAMGEK